MFNVIRCCFNETYLTKQLSPNTDPKKENQRTNVATLWQYQLIREVSEIIRYIYDIKDES